MAETSYFKSATSYSMAEYAAVFKTIHLDGVDASIANYLKVYYNVGGAMVLQRQQSPGGSGSDRDGKQCH